MMIECVTGQVVIQEERYSALGEEHDRHVDADEHV